MFSEQLREAMFSRPASESGAVRCDLCGHRCLIREGRRGICRVRENRGGVLVPLAYGRLVALSPDPIEKKPLFHVLPGSFSLSIASLGCNLACRWCQNHHLVAPLRRGGELRGRVVRPEAVVAAALEEGCASISYTYSEPTIHYEHNRDVGVAARAAGLKNVFVTNGLMTAEVARDAAASFLDAANVDLKALRAETYRTHCKAGRRGLETVLEAITVLHERGVWVEVTTLVIPGLNDSEAELRDAARFLRGLSPDLPWHLSRYHPAFEWDAPPTPASTLSRAREIGLEEGLRYVYTGNLASDEGSHTSCPACSAIVIRRRGSTASPEGLRRDGTGSCARCGERIAGLGLP